MRFDIRGLVYFTLRRYDLSLLSDEYRKLFNEDVICDAVDAAVADKYNRLPYVEEFVLHINTELPKIIDELYNKTYECSGYYFTTIYDECAGKFRNMKIPKFKDIVVQHIFYEAYKDIIDKHTSHRTGCGIKDRGLKLVNKSLVNFFG